MAKQELTDEERNEIMQEFVNGGTLEPDAVQGGYTTPTAGEYVGKLIAVDVLEVGQAKRPSIVARFELVQALRKECESSVGMDASAFFKLDVLPPKIKGGKPFAPGYKEAFDAMAAVNGGKTPVERPGLKVQSDGTAVIDGDQFRKIIAKHLGKKLLRIALVDSKYTDKQTKEVKSIQRLKIIALHKTAPVAAADSDEDDLV